MTDQTSSIPTSATANDVRTSYSTRHAGEVRALFHGHLIAASDKVMVVRQEAGAAHYYFPQDAVEMSVLQPNDRTDRSALGEARYFTLYRDREILEDAAWSYASDSATVSDLAGLVAFNPEYVDIEIDEDAMVAAESPVIDEYIRHTDSGSGQSQETAWDPTVGRPGDGA